MNRKAFWKSLFAIPLVAALSSTKAVAVAQKKRPPETELWLVFKGQRFHFGSHDERAMFRFWYEKYSSDPEGKWVLRRLLAGEYLEPTQFEQDA